jgi:BlaI family penicillinase repressor
MAKKKQPAKLSIGEMRLMSVLWKCGPLKLSEAYQQQPGEVGYTTIQTQLNRLVEKGAVARSKTRPTRYRALVQPDVASAGMLQLLTDTLGGGSVIPLVEQLILQSPLTKEDIQELRQILNRAGKQLTQSKKQTGRPGNRA